MTKIIHYRQSIRLKNYDYSHQGAYFITICSYNRACLFGQILHGDNDTKYCNLNNYGEIIYQEWFKTSLIRKNISLDTFIIMPNHIHGIVMINQPSIFGKSITETDDHHILQNLANIIRGFKAATTTRINLLRNTPKNPVWQRNYYEHIIRNESSLEKIREYIINNAYTWEKDKFFKGL